MPGAKLFVEIRNRCLVTRCPLSTPGHDLCLHVFCSTRWQVGHLQAKRGTSLGHSHHPALVGQTGVFGAARGTANVTEIQIENGLRVQPERYGDVHARSSQDEQNTIELSRGKSLKMLKMLELM